MGIDATLDLAAAARRRWDTIVVGAGPAGALAARELARRGQAVLLVDRAPFPRAKVCGCCLTTRAHALLVSVGLGRLLDESRAQPLAKLKLAAAGSGASLRVGGWALSRQVFDAALVKAAMVAGCHFLPETLARLASGADGGRTLLLRSTGREAPVSGLLVLGAGGLGSGEKLLEAGRATAAGSRLGAGTAAEEFPAFYEEGSIFMACGAAGYVGLVRLEDGRLNIAAAFDPTFVKQSGGPGRAAAAIVDEAGLPAISGLAALDWHGTPLLTRRCQPPAAERVFLIGDAAGYLEPFTGEGMAWALEGALAVVPLALRAHGSWDASLVRAWSRRHHQVIARRHWLCRLAAGVLRRPRLVRIIVPVLARFPWLAAPVLRYLHHGM